MSCQVRANKPYGAPSSRSLVAWDTRRDERAPRRFFLSSFFFLHCIALHCIALHSSSSSSSYTYNLIGYIELGDGTFAACLPLLTLSLSRFVSGVSFSFHFIQIPSPRLIRLAPTASIRLYVGRQCPLQIHVRHVVKYCRRTFPQAVHSPSWSMLVAKQLK